MFTRLWPRKAGLEPVQGRSSLKPTNILVPMSFLPTLCAVTVGTPKSKLKSPTCGAYRQETVSSRRLEQNWNFPSPSASEVNS